MDVKRDRWTRRRAPQALGMIGEKRAVNTLLKLLDDAELEVRLNAIYSLGWLKARESVKSLMQLAGRAGKNERARLAAIIALGRIGDEKARSLFEKIRGKGVFREGLKPTPRRAAELALRYLKAGGGKGIGIYQPDFLRLREHFYYLRDQFNHTLGRYFTYPGRPYDMEKMYFFLSEVGGTIVASMGILRKGGGEPEQYDARKADELGVKILVDYPLDYPFAFLEKSTPEWTVERWRGHESFGGFWWEETLWPRHFLKSRMFRKYLAKKCMAESLRKKDISDLSKVMLLAYGNASKLL